MKWWWNCGRLGRVQVDDPTGNQRMMRDDGDYGGGFGSSWTPNPRGDKGFRVAVMKIDEASERRRRLEERTGRR